MSDSEQPRPAETMTGETTVTVHRSVRYSRFMVAGAVLGVFAALIFTFTFPENDTFSRTQVFGFLLLVGVAAGVGLGGIVALIVDRVVGRRGTTVTAGRLAPDASSAIEPRNDAADS